MSGGNKAFSGWFENPGRREHPSAIRHIGFFGRLCFDVELDHEGARWCVSVRGDDTVGVWTTGPEGGKELEGMGAGARLFTVKARRISPIVK